MFMTDLARAIALPLEIDFMAVSSYGNATRTSGVVRIVKDLDIDLTGPRRPHRGGHRRLRAHALVPAPHPRRPGRQHPRGVRPARARGPPEDRRGPALRRASGSRRSSWSATASTSPRSTATCPTSASSRARLARRPAGEFRCRRAPGSLLASMKRPSRATLGYILIGAIALFFATQFLTKDEKPEELTLTEFHDKRRRRRGRRPPPSRTSRTRSPASSRTAPSTRSPSRRSSPTS